MDIQHYFDIASQIVLIASILANFTKTDTDNKIIKFVGDSVNFFAINWSKNVNK